MSEPAFNNEASRQARGFRLVGDERPEAGAEPAATLENRAADAVPGTDAGIGAGTEAIVSMVPSRLLVARSEWQDGAGRCSWDQMVVRATIPLLGSLARIRSEADAALALTGVLEGLVRRFHVTPPCTLFDETTVAFVAPVSLDLEATARMIDDALVGQVRATDLQGALRQRMEATVERADEP
jgi:hypothetical protein